MSSAMPKEYTSPFTVSADIGTVRKDPDHLSVASYDHSSEYIGAVACLHVGPITFQSQDTRRFRDIAAAFIEAADKADRIARRNADRAAKDAHAEQTRLLGNALTDPAEAVE